MTNKIQIKRSSVGGKSPAATDLEIGELAVNFADRDLYTKTAAGAVINLTESLQLGATATTAAPGDHTHPFADITATPTTLSGYGITDVAITCFSDTDSYPANGMVKHADGIWRAKTILTPAAWDPTKWTRIDTDGVVGTGSGPGGVTPVIAGSLTDLTAALNQLIASQLYIERDPTASQSIINGGSITDVPLAIQGAAGQTGNLQDWADSTGKILAAVLPEGSVVIGADPKHLAAGASTAFGATKTTGTRIYPDGSLDMFNATTGGLVEINRHASDVTGGVVAIQTYLSTETNLALDVVAGQTGAAIKVMSTTANPVFTVSPLGLTTTVGGLHSPGAGANSFRAGFNAGLTLQGIGASAIGRGAGTTSQGTNAVAVGTTAGSTLQGQGAVALGYLAGRTSQGKNALAIGTNAGVTSQGLESVALGAYSGTNNQGDNALAIGHGAGGGDPSDATKGQGDKATAIGAYAGQIAQGEGGIALGASAAKNYQGAHAVAIGDFAGFGGSAAAGAASVAADGMGDYGIAIGFQAQQANAGDYAIAIGNESGRGEQSIGSIAIGDRAARAGQQFASVAIGQEAGHFHQGKDGAAIVAGTNYTGAGMCVAVGYKAQQGFAEEYAVAIGSSAGFRLQRIGSVAIGASAGKYAAEKSSVAIGIGAGKGTVGPESTLGEDDGIISAWLREDCVAIGRDAAGNGTAGDSTVAIGVTAGQTRQGANAVAIGRSAGQADQHANSIVISSTGFNVGTSAVGQIYIRSTTADLKTTGANWAHSGTMGPSSDIRLKENVEPITDALAKVNSLNGITFSYIKNGTVATGLIAQEVQAVLPEAVIEDADGYLAVGYGNMVGLLVEAIKEQQKQIDALIKAN